MTLVAPHAGDHHHIAFRIDHHRITETFPARYLAVDEEAAYPLGPVSHPDRIALPVIPYRHRKIGFLQCHSVQTVAFS